MGVVQQGVDFNQAAYKRCLLADPEDESKGMRPIVPGEKHPLDGYVEALGLPEEERKALKDTINEIRNQLLDEVDPVHRAMVSRELMAGVSNGLFMGIAIGRMIGKVGVPDAY